MACIHFLFCLFLPEKIAGKSRPRKTEKVKHIFSIDDGNEHVSYFRTRVISTAYKNPTAIPKEADVQNAKLFVGQ